VNRFTFLRPSRIFLRMKWCATLWLALALPALAGSAGLKMFPLEKNLLCVRAGEVSENFPMQFQAAEPTNPVAGIILDLRLAGGTNATGVAGFLAAKKVPLVVLTGTQTQGAAAAMAGEMHAAGAVVIACGTNAVAEHPADLRVRLPAEDEKRFLENPFTNATPRDAGKLAGATNLMFFVDHTSEAELVRKSVKDGDEDGTNIPRSLPAQPVINDPALARAVDLLKALTVLRRTRG
jgi:hypothetical protein